MSFGDSNYYAVIAQSVVRHIGNVEVSSSILDNSSPVMIGSNPVTMI